MQDKRSTPPTHRHISAGIRSSLGKLGEEKRARVLAVTDANRAASPSVNGGAIATTGEADHVRVAKSTVVR
jgi:hypothetical protein